MLSKIEKNKILEGRHGKPILVDVFLNGSGTKKPVVLFCHGYKGFKDWGCWDLVGKAFANAGFCFIKFNFSHNGGTVEQPIDFPDLDAFGNNNYSKELDDLETVIEWVSDTEFSYNTRVDIENIILIGHSRGGGIVTIKTAEDHRVTKVISWAGVSNSNRFGTPEKIAQWKKEGVTYVMNGRTKQNMPLYYQFYENFKANEERLSIEKAARNLKVPHAIIHGDADETVGLNEANSLHEWNPNSYFYTIQGANHVFGGKHPWSDPVLPKHLAEVVDLSIRFIKK